MGADRASLLDADYHYYDLADRPIATVNVGTNGGSNWNWSSAGAPARSDTVLVTSRTYDAAGRVYEVTDPKGRVTRTSYDALGRVTKTVENYIDGTVGDDNDKTTEYAYNAAGMTKLTARLAGNDVQTTEWVYGVTVGSGSSVTSNDVVGATRWPDPSSGAASGDEEDTVTVNALGQVRTATDRNETVHTYSYDVLGRLTQDAVTTLGEDVDGTVRRIETAYDGQGNPYLLTSYDEDADGDIVNQVQRAYNGLGQLTIEYQSHSGAVNTGSTPKVIYAYSEMPSGANHSRLTSVTYPSGYVLTYNYASGIDAAISRLSSLSEGTSPPVTLESYDYLGLGTVVRRAHPEPGVDLTYIKQGGESNGDAGDPYTGFDRFGRVVDQRWLKTSNGSHTDRFQYGYDRNSNRTYRDNVVSAAFGEVYTYDGLDQVASFARGTLDGSKTGISGSPSRSQEWDYDPVGNWDSLTTDGGSPQTRTANRQNEITSIGGATSPTFDAAGNMTKDETGKQFVYDAWNRLVAVKDSGGTTIAAYQYDGLGRRVKETRSGTTTELYYSAGWQVLEERVGGSAKAQYVWSPVYVDALVLRDRDADGNGSLEERLWVVQDANFNVTALVDGSGNVVERYAYDPFGAVTVYDASWAVRSGGSIYAWAYRFQGLRRDLVTGTDCVRGREYHPVMGRPLQVDPIHYAAGDVNLYRWEGNAPLNRVDPFGLKYYAHVRLGQQCVIDVFIRIHFVGNSPSLNRLAAQWSQAIANAWSGSAECKEFLVCKTSKCQVNVVVVWKVNPNWWDRRFDGFENTIRIDTDPSGRSHVDGVGGSTGTWYDHAIDWVAVHEAGHLLGLDDYYTDMPRGGSVPMPGFSGTVMGSYGGSVNTPAPGLGGMNFRDKLLCNILKDHQKSLGNLPG